MTKLDTAVNTGKEANINEMEDFDISAFDVSATDDSEASIMDDDVNDIVAELEALDADDDSIDATEQELNEDELLALQVNLDKADAYSNQEAEETIGNEDAPVEAEAATDKVVEKVAKEKKAPRKTMAGGKKSDVIRDRLTETLILEVDDAKLSPTELEASQDTLLDYIDTEMAVKVAEKAVNLISAANGHAKLSAYTIITLRFLEESASAGITVKNLVEHLQDQKANGVKGYSDGTAKSQAHQMFKLLPTLKVASMNGKVMTINEDSILMVALREVI